MAALTREERTLRFRARIGPHKQTSDPRIVDVPARGGVMAYKSYLVQTACGREVSTTTATRRDDLVKCPNCLDPKANVPTSRTAAG